MITALFLAICLHATGQQKPQDIVAEGKLMYRSEAASWHGTDIFLARLKHKSDYIGGYFSYPTAIGATCVFFAKGDSPKTLAVISFDSTYNLQTAQIDSLPRDLTRDENDLYIIRNKALAIVNKDTLFKKYNNTTLNVVPMINRFGRKAYVLTGPELPNFVIFGNDYQIDFNKKNVITNTTRLHKNILPIEYGKGNVSLAGMHSHLPPTGEYITATDICTLMLYAKYPGWGQHYVISKKYVSVWDCKNNRLATLTRKAWDRINKDQKQRQPEQSRQ